MTTQINSQIEGISLQNSSSTRKNSEIIHNLLQVYIYSLRQETR